jgi:hypothetical protein
VGIGSGVGRGDVEDAVAVEVRYRDGDGPIARRKRDGGLEAAVAISSQHAHVMANVIGGDEVEYAITV